MRLRFRLNFAVVFLCWLAVPVAASAEDRGQLLATARDGNRAAIQSIRTLEFRFERVPGAGTTLEQAREQFHVNTPGRFWLSGDSYRLIDTYQNGLTREILYRDGKSLILGYGGPPPNDPSLKLAIPVGVDGVGGEIWKYLQFSHWGNKVVTYVPFWDILQQPHTISSVQRLPAPGREIYVELTHGGGRLRFWFDPKTNYLVRKKIMNPAKDPSFQWEDEVVEFAEPSPAVFVPAVIEHRGYYGGHHRATVRTVLSDVKANHQLHRDALRLPSMITRLECFDTTRDVKYKVDADGRQAGPEVSAKVHRIAPSGPGYQPPDPLPVVEPSRPPTPKWVWLLVASSALLLAGLGLAVVRRVRAAREQ